MQNLTFQTLLRVFDGTFGRGLFWAIVVVTAAIGAAGAIGLTLLTYLISAIQR